MKQRIVVKNWKRKETFEFFSSFDDPYMGIGIPVDITSIINYIEGKDISITEMLSYLVLKSINEVDDFKYCLENGEVYKYDKINLSFTVLNSEKMIQFTNIIEYDKQIQNFLGQFRKEKKDAELGRKCKGKITVNNIYISCMPWCRVNFIKHPCLFNEVDSVPRILWGQIYDKGDRKYIDLAIQVNHAFQDGYQIGLLINKINDNISELK